MFNTYADIFNKRGAAYHEAMQRYPAARDEEFETIIGLLEPEDGHVIVDMPSGGGYMREYIGSSKVQLIAIETTEAFYAQCKEDDCTRPLLCDLHNTGLSSDSIDAVASMAGFHHVEDRQAVFAEIYRILKPGAKLCIADVAKNSLQDDFLNIFVNQYNSMGHEGHFIDNDFRHSLREVGFDIKFDEQIKYTWKFDDVEQMVTYCMLMFGLDKATPQQVLNGIKKYQGYEISDSACNMHWELRFISCVRK